MNLSQAIEGYLLFKSTRASPRTIETDRGNLGIFLKYLGDRPVSEITAEDVRAFVIHLQDERGLSKWTIRRYYAAISAMYTWLISPQVELATINPTQGVPAPKLPVLKVKALSREQITALFAAVSHSNNPRRDRALLLFLLDTGARATEVTSLVMGNVDFKNGKVRVMGKGSKERFVYLGKRALSALWLYVNEERKEPTIFGDEHLFLTSDGYPIKRSTLRHIIRRLAEQAGFHAHTHQFRHTAAIEHLRHGMDLVSLQHLMGHASIKTTRIYLTALSDEDVGDRARRSSPGDNWRL